MERGVPYPKGRGISWLIQLISLVTIVSGLVQLAMPQFVLKLVGATRDLTTEHFFAIIGMFMAIFGAMLLQAVRSPTDQRVAVFWAAMQKFGASAAVVIGFERHVFSALALAIAAFDGLSGCLILWYRTRRGTY
jgi:hypothetical protein